MKEKLISLLDKSLEETEKAMASGNITYATECAMLAEALSRTLYNMVSLDSDSENMAKL